MEDYVLRSRADPPPSVEEDQTDRQTDRQTRDLAEHDTTASILPASTVVSSMLDTLSEEIISIGAQLTLGVSHFCPKMYV